MCCVVLVVWSYFQRGQIKPILYTAVLYHEVVMYFEVPTKLSQRDNILPSLSLKNLVVHMYNTFVYVHK